MFRLPWSTTKNASAPLALALQGGGAHGAYTWGVLDRLLEAGVPIEGISGTSAGAMNAVALAEGWTMAARMAHAPRSTVSGRPSATAFPSTWSCCTTSIPRETAASPRR